MATIEERVRKCVEQHPDWKTGRRAHALRLSISEVTNIMRKLKLTDSTDQDPVGKPSPVGISAKDMLGRFDYETRLAETITKMCRGRFVLDSDIRAESGIPGGVFRRVADMERFTDNKIRDGEKLYWSTPDNVKSVRDRQKAWGLSR